MLLYITLPTMMESTSCFCCSFLWISYNLFFVAVWVVLTSFFRNKPWNETRKTNKNKKKKDNTTIKPVCTFAQNEQQQKWKRNHHNIERNNRGYTAVTTCPKNVLPTNYSLSFPKGIWILTLRHHYFCVLWSFCCCSLHFVCTFFGVNIF